MTIKPRYNIDLINPEHYKQGSVECIDYIRDRLGYEGYKAYLLGSHYKYTYRFTYKHKHLEPLEKITQEEADIKKSMFYLCRFHEIQRLEKETLEQNRLNREEVAYDEGSYPNDVEKGFVQAPCDVEQKDADNE